MKKIIIAIIVFIVVIAFTMPIFADTDNQGQGIKELAQKDNGTGLSDWVWRKKNVQTEITGKGLGSGVYTWDNHGQFMQLWKARWYFKDLKE